GDFLRRRVSDGFIGVWDSWLQESLATSRSALGDKWLDIYLTNPGGRFACAAGACGAAPGDGVVVPRGERGGRSFALTLVAELPTDTAGPASIALNAHAFFEAAEHLVIDTFESDQIDIEQFDQQLIRVGEQFDPARLSPRVVLDAASALLDDPADGW